MVALSPRELASPTGEVFRPGSLYVARPEWFFRAADTFNPAPCAVPTVAQLARAAVAAWPDLMRAELHGRLMSCCPRARFTADTLSNALSCDPGIAMFRDGVRVEGAGHDARCCTFRLAGHAEERAAAE